MIPNNEPPMGNCTVPPSHARAIGKLLQLRLIGQWLPVHKAVHDLLASLVGLVGGSRRPLKNATRRTAREDEGRSQKVSHPRIKPWQRGPVNLMRGCEIHLQSLGAGAVGPPGDHKIELVSKGNRNGR